MMRPLLFFPPFALLASIALFAHAADPDSLLEPYPVMTFLAPVRPADACIVNGVYVRDDLAALCCDGASPKAPAPQGCPQQGEATTTILSVMTSFGSSSDSAFQVLTSAEKLTPGSAVDTVVQPGGPDPAKVEAGGKVSSKPTVMDGTPEAPRAAATAATPEGVSVIEFSGPKPAKPKSGVTSPARTQKPAARR